MHHIYYCNNIAFMNYFTTFELCNMRNKIFS